MKNLILFFLFLNLSFAAIAQVNLDSLFSIWNDTTQQDTSRLQAISIICFDGYLMSKPDSAYYYSQLQYELAEATGHTKWRANAIHNQGISFAVKSDYIRAFEYLFRGLEVAEASGDFEEIAASLNDIGVVYYKKGEYVTALEYFTRSLIIKEKNESESNNWKAGQASNLVNIGNIHKMQGDLKQAIEAYSHSLKLAEKRGEKYRIITVQNNIAGIYAMQGDYPRAIQLYSQNLIIAEEIGNLYQASLDLIGLGTCHRGQGDYTKALEYYIKAIQAAKKLGDKSKVAHSLIEVGGLYMKQDNFPKALEYLTEALQICEEIEYKAGIATTRMSIGYIYGKQGNHAKAISYTTDVLLLYQEAENIIGEINAAGSLAMSYKAVGKYQKALEMTELTFKMRDSLTREENQKSVIQLQVKSDYEKQKAIDDLENEKRVAIETQKKENQQKLSIAIGIGLLLISFLALVIFNRLKVTRQQKAIIEEQKKKVEQSEKYKEQFLANMSHEIRTPMHAISGMVKILERNEHPPSQDVFLHAMKTSSDNLVVILNDVLDLSKIEAGKLDIESIPTSPAAVIENVTQILKYKAEEKGLQLNYQIDEEVPELIMGDPTRLNQILINLASNAIKFTEKGNVNILLQKENDRLKFSVKDTGIGIPKEKIEKIFGAFEQAKDSTTRSYGGTGLGLSISKQLVELQSGKIWAESEEGQGSTFFIELPLVIAASNAINEGIITEDKLKKMTTSLEGIRVLLAEDNPFNQMIAQDDLSFFIKSIKIDVVENGALAVEKFKTGNYDLILMDVQMPVMNGFEATRKIREIEKSEGKETAIPIIAMTASLLKSEVDNCYNSGMNNYIPKPYKSEELIAPIFSELNKS